MTPDLVYTITIPGAVVDALNSRRAKTNEQLPQTVEQAGVQVPNPALLGSATQYVDFVLGSAFASYKRDHDADVAAGAAPPPAPGPVLLNGVPQVVDMVKAQVYLARIGKLTDVENAVTASGVEAKIIWAKSKTIQRQNPLIVAIGKSVLLYTDAELDNMFVEADKVVI